MGISEMGTGRPFWKRTNDGTNTFSWPFLLLSSFIFLISSVLTCFALDIPYLSPFLESYVFWFLDLPHYYFYPFYFWLQLCPFPALWFFSLSLLWPFSHHTVFSHLETKKNPRQFSISYVLTTASSSRGWWPSQAIFPHPSNLRILLQSWCLNAVISFWSLFLLIPSQGFPSFCFLQPTWYLFTSAVPDSLMQ